MYKHSLYFILAALPFYFGGCKSKVETIQPSLSSITESIYASGSIKAEGQYQVFAPISGVIDKILVEEGSLVKNGDPILIVANEAQQLTRENAELSAKFSDLKANQGKLDEAQTQLDALRTKVKNDSTMLERQRNLWRQQIGSEVELEQRDLAFQNSKLNLQAAIIRYKELKRQLDFSSSQAQKNLAISGKMERDFMVKSEINGIVYGLFKKKGEIVSPQTLLAVIGSGGRYLLEMQVDEVDIVRVQKGQRVMVTMESYKGEVFEAVVSKINPLMDERSRTFMVEAVFKTQPKVLYPNITFEANIILNVKKDVVLVPRNYLVGDSLAVLEDGSMVKVKVGMKDYSMAEIISGLQLLDKIQKPGK